MKRTILTVLTAIAVVLSTAFSAALWFLIAGFRSIAGFLGGNAAVTPALLLVCAVVILPALMALAAIPLRRHAAVRAVVVGIAFGLAVLEAGLGVLVAVELYGDRPAARKAVTVLEGNPCASAERRPS